MVPCSARFKRRRKPEQYRPIPPLEREAPGSDPRQRPLTQKPKPLEQPQLDNIYHDAHVGEITAELVRPQISATNQWGGWTVDKMRIVFLARACQTRLPYVHSCSAMYCLKIVDGIKARTLYNALPHIQLSRSWRVFDYILPFTSAFLFVRSKLKIGGQGQCSNIYPVYRNRSTCRFFFPTRA